MERYRLPVPVHSYSIMAPNISIFYPQLMLLNPMHQHKLNDTIFTKMDGMFLQVKELGYYEPGVTEIIGNYEMKNNQRGIVSFTFTLFANMPSLAHPVEFMDSLTADVQSGEIYQLKDLFKQGSDYEARINAIIEEQIKRRDIPLLNGFPGISPNQKYYIADKTLVIYFNEYDISPGYAGFPMFPIPAFELQDITKENSPLDVLSV
ncbi:RsiV family protein [Alteribacillus bidgolensis]|uniref:DUF3298 domain-containing protein n=1 Tax=Alteribacillus bidgolensis TaxID=930129 RepID=A0A1G8L045_9BACI|nr:RsiV family protein [Alteribacillus bidgolensis]SDI49003.1 Protein of unknown function [Alteribacillus bidgolensis]